MPRIRVGAALLIMCVLLGQEAASADTEASWNGRVLPGAVPDRSKPAMFLPYYVPEGM